MLTKKQKFFIAACAAVLLHVLFFSYSFDEPLLTDPLQIFSIGPVRMSYAEASLYLFQGAFIPQLLGLVTPLLVLVVVGFMFYNDLRATPLAAKQDRGSNS